MLSTPYSVPYVEGHGDGRLGLTKQSHGNADDEGPCRFFMAWGLGHKGLFAWKRPCNRKRMASSSFLPFSLNEVVGVTSFVCAWIGILRLEGFPSCSVGSFTSHVSQHPAWVFLFASLFLLLSFVFSSFRSQFFSTDYLILENHNNTLQLGKLSI